MSTAQQQSTPSDPNKNINQFNKFLQNNHEFLLQKYSQHFGSQPFTFTELQTKPKIQLSIKFIYDVFSFQKYEKDQKMNNTLKRSLKDNIISFIKKQLAESNNNIKEKKVFGQNEGIKLLKFCIEHNQMFAVHYDKKEEKKQSIKEQKKQKNQEQLQKQQQKQQQNQQKQEQLVKPMEQQQNTKKQSPIIHKNQINHLEQQKNQQETHKINPPKTKSLQEQLQQQSKHNQILKKQAKVVFDFYCKQQTNACGPASTFDRIYHQSQVMTLGKFIVFANITGILYNVRVKSFLPTDHKVLDKKTINQIWRNVSRCKKQVNFDQFFQILKQFNNIDSSVYDKLNMGKQQTTNKILRKLKYLNIPFNMKGQFTKQTNIIIDQKPYIVVPTSHSGKFTHSIQEDMVERKQKLKYLPFRYDKNYNQIKMNSEEYDKNNLNISVVRSSVKLQNIIPESNKIPTDKNYFISQVGNPQKKIKTSQIPQVNKIRLQNSRISIENGKQFQNHQLLKNLIVLDDDINDEQFLKDYKIPQLTSHINIKRRQTNDVHGNVNFNVNNDKKDRLSRMKNRKNIVNEYKQRVRQVEKSQTKHQNSRDNRKRSIHSLYSRN